MIKVEFLGPISKEPIEVDIQNLSDLKSILQADSSLHPWLENSAVAINNKITSDINTPLKDGDTVSLLPPVCGG